MTKLKLAVPPKRTLTVPPRFTRATETVHGRMAMVGLTLGAVLEATTRLTVPQQLGPHAGELGAAVAAVTLGFVLNAAVGASGSTAQEPEVDVLGAPGWTPATETLHGRMAMLGVAYVLLAEGLWARPVFLGY